MVNIYVTSCHHIIDLSTFQAVTPSTSATKPTPSYSASTPPLVVPSNASNPNGFPTFVNPTQRNPIWSSDSVGSIANKHLWVQFRTLENAGRWIYLGKSITHPRRSLTPNVIFEVENRFWERLTEWVLFLCLSVGPLALGFSRRLGLSFSYDFMRLLLVFLCAWLRLTVLTSDLFLGYFFGYALSMSSSPWRARFTIL